MAIEVTAKQLEAMLLLASTAQSILGSISTVQELSDDDCQTLINGALEITKNLDDRLDKH